MRNDINYCLGASENHLGQLECQYFNYCPNQGLGIFITDIASNFVRMKCKVGRDSVKVKVLLFQLGALVSNSVHMKCKVGRESVEVQILLFQLGALVSNFVRMEYTVAREVQVLLF